MKAVVLEIKNNEAAVLKEDGTIVKIRRKCTVGETIELEEKTKTLTFRPMMKRIAAAAAAFIIVSAASGGYYYTTVQAASYVTVDSDSSIEYALNRRNQVVSVNALDEEGAALKAQMEEDGFSKCSLTEAMERTEKAREALEIDIPEKPEEIIISVTSDNDRRREALTEELQTWIDEKTDEQQPAPIEILEGTTEDRAAANDEGLSTGRYLKEHTAPDGSETLTDMPADTDMQETSPELPDQENIPDTVETPEAMGTAPEISNGTTPESPAAPAVTENPDAAEGITLPQDTQMPQDIQTPENTLPEGTEQPALSESGMPGEMPDVSIAP